MKRGKVYLVGAGPGDPDLISVKGLKILQQAEVLIYDWLVEKGVLKYVNSQAELICAAKSKREKVIKIMVKKAKEGKKVVRLKNGDPFIFGRGQEEVEALTRNRIEFAVIPGITAATAAGCFSGIPLTARGISSSVIFTTGHETSQKSKGFVDWEKIAQADTIVLYMAVENLPSLAQKLILSGKKKDTPVAVISQVSKIGQRTLVSTLKKIQEEGEREKISAPAIVIIGEVVKKERNFNWFKKSKKILFTGISPERFFEKGIIFHLPLIEIKPWEDYTGLNNLIKKMDIFDWIVFSSRFGVLYFFQQFFKMGFDTRWLKGIKIAAIGSSTAGELKRYGIIADLIPSKESSSGLLREFKKLGIKGKKILLPRSDIADKGLTRGLGNLGAEVYPCVAYRNVMPKNLPDMDLNFFEEIIFTSPSTVRNFVKRYGKPPEKIKIRTIGPVTRREAQKWGLVA